MPRTTLTERATGMYLAKHLLDPAEGRKGGKNLQDRSKAAYIFRQAPHGGAPASFGQLVRLGFDVTVFTPASYLRHRL